MKSFNRFFMKAMAFVLLLTMTLHPSTSYADDIVIKEGTEVLLKVIDRLKSGAVQQGSIIRFLVERAVTDEDGVILIQDDAFAYGTVITSTKAGMMGTSGKLEITVDYVDSFNGMKIPLRSTQEVDGASSTGAVVAGFLFVSMLSVFFRGDNAVVESGTIFSAYVDKTTVLSADLTPSKDTQIALSLDGHLGIVTATEKTAQGGLLIQEVTPGSMSDAAGIKKGDILVKVDSYDLKSNDTERLAAYVGLRIGQKAAIKATILRDGRSQVVNLLPDK
jgi:Periplasmic protease